MTEAAPSVSYDHRVVLHNVSWEDYERILEIRGESSGVRIAYRSGELELMSPSLDHEFIKTMLARLLEAWAEERNVELNGIGSWTVKRKAEKCGLEPDECYVVGVHRPDRPDIAIEVIWTHGGIGKLEIYHGLGVPEVWFWEGDAVAIWTLDDDGGGYTRVDRSRMLPELDLEQLLTFFDRESQTQAVRRYRAALRGD